MARKKGPTPKRVHRSDSVLQQAYDRLYAELGRRNLEVTQLQVAVGSLERRAASLTHALEIAVSAARGS